LEFQPNEDFWDILSELEGAEMVFLVTIEEALIKPVGMAMPVA
jgi:hypothetical protein